MSLIINIAACSTAATEAIDSAQQAQVGDPSPVPSPTCTACLIQGKGCKDGRCWCTADQCWAGGHCRRGVTDAFCGSFFECASCGAGLMCADQQCVPAPACADDEDCPPSDEPGVVVLCGADKRCSAHAVIPFLGHEEAGADVWPFSCASLPDGAACLTFQGKAGRCLGTACCTGCIKGGECFQGTTMGACGDHGAACDTCNLLSEACEGGACVEPTCANGGSCTFAPGWTGSCSDERCCWSCLENGNDGAGPCPYVLPSGAVTTGVCMTGICCLDGYCQEPQCL